MTHDPDEVRVPAGYRWVRPLGQGCFGTVHLCVQESLNRHVVLKILREGLAQDPQLLEQFLLEAKVTSALTHPYIVVILDHGLEPGFPWIVFEYLPGGNLRSVLSRGPVPFVQACTITAQMAAALDAAHRIGVIHRDVKPENIMQGEPGVYKLTDFGIARWSREDQRDHGDTVLGTPGYIAPEVALGAEPDVQSDLYSLAVTFFELCTGRRPFQGKNLSAILANQYNHFPRLEIPGVGNLQEFDAILRRSFVPEVENRYASIGSFYADFELAYQDHEGTSQALLPAKYTPSSPHPPVLRGPGFRSKAVPRETEKIEIRSSSPGIEQLISTPGSAKDPAKAKHPGLPGSPRSRARLALMLIGVLALLAAALWGLAR